MLESWDIVVKLFNTDVSNLLLRHNLCSKLYVLLLTIKTLEKSHAQQVLPFLEECVPNRKI
jgi:hypothetical protein